MFYAQQETEVNLEEDAEWDSISAITFSQNVHYTNVWWSINLLCTKIQIGQQLENKKAAVSWMHTTNTSTITLLCSMLD